MRGGPSHAWNWCDEKGLNVATNADFMGTWELVSVQRWQADGPLIFQGDGAIGCIIYDATGRITFQIMYSTNRPHEYVNEPNQLGYGAYFGSYEIDRDAGTVTHHIIANLNPDLVGTQQKRFFEFSGKLRTPPNPANVTSEFV